MWRESGWDGACAYFGRCWGVRCKRDGWRPKLRPLPSGTSGAGRRLAGCPSDLITLRERSAYDLLRTSQMYGHALPVPGSLTDQLAWLTTAHRILSDELLIISRGEDEQAARRARLRDVARKAQGL